MSTKSRIDWQVFGRDLEGAIVASDLTRRDLEISCDLGHAVLWRAIHGQPIGTEYFLTLCSWLGADPMYYFVWSRAA